MPQEQDGFPGLQEPFVAKTINLHLILDVSPSMRTRWDQTISGLNEYFASLRQDQKDNEQPYLVTLTTFSASIATPYDAVELDAIPTFTEKNLQPNGWGTALYDAVGETVKKINTSDPVLVVILTDGEENSSGKWDESSLAKLTDERAALGNYTYAYLGVAKEAWGNAAKMGGSVARSSNNVDATQYYGRLFGKDRIGHTVGVSGLTSTYSASMRSATKLQQEGVQTNMSVENFFDAPEVESAETSAEAGTTSK